MNDLQEQLPGPRVENENRPINGLCSQIPFKSLMNCHPIHISIVHKPYHLVGEQISVILGVEVRFGGFRRVELKAFANTLAKNVDGWVGFHDLVHSLEVECADTWEPVTKCRVHVVGQIDGNEAAGGGWVNGDVVSSVVKELGTGISLNIMRVKITPSQLDINPVLIGSSPVIVLLLLMQKTGLTDLPLEGCKKNNVRT